MAPLPGNTAYRMLNPLRRAPLAPNTGYGLLNPGTTLPVTSHQGETPPPVTDPTNPGSADPRNSPIPGIDPFLQSAATTAYQNALNQVNQGRTSALTKYGYKATSFDDQGNPVGLGVDPNSLYGDFQQLLRSQGQEATADEADAADRGLAGSGLGKQAEGNSRYDWGAADLNLGSSLTGTLGQLSAQALGAKDAYNTTMYQGSLDAINQALANGDFMPVDDQYTPTVPWDDNATTPPDATTVSRPSVKGKTVLWGNSYKNATQLAKTLTAQGSSVRTFIQQHPAAAKAIGLKPPAAPVKKKPAKGGGGAKNA